MCMFIYIYIHTHTCTHVCVYINIYIYIYICNMHLTCSENRRPAGRDTQLVVAGLQPSVIIIIMIMIHPVSITRFPLIIFSLGAELLRNPLFIGSGVRFSSGWVRKDGNLLTETGCIDNDNNNDNNNNTCAKPQLLQPSFRIALQNWVPGSRNVCCYLAVRHNSSGPTWGDPNNAQKPECSCRARTLVPNGSSLRHQTPDPE